MAFPPWTPTGIDKEIALQYENSEIMKSVYAIKFDVIDRVTPGSIKARTQHTRFQVDVVDLCFSLASLARKSKITHIFLNIGTKKLSLPEAYDIALALKKCVDADIHVTAYAEKLNLANLLAMAYGHIRCCPPLAGPLDLSMQFQHFEIAQFLARLGISVLTFRSGVAKSGKIDVLENGISASVIEREKQIATLTLHQVRALIKDATNKDIRVDGTGIYATAADVAEAGFITHTHYAEFLASISPAFAAQRWESPQVLASLDQITHRRWPARLIQSKTPFLILEWISRSPLFENTSATYLSHILATTCEELKIAGILLIMDCQGGDLSDADRLWCLITHLKKRFPIVVYIRNALSAGYCCASAGTQIIVNPSAVVGSIGTVTARFDASQLLQRLGLDFQLALGDDEGSIGSFLSAPQLAERTMLQQRMQIGAELFKARIMSARKFEVSQLETFADGGIFSAEESISNNLADQTGTLLAAFDLLTQLSNDRNDTRIVRAQFQSPPPLSEISQLLSTVWSR